MRPDDLKRQLCTAFCGTVNVQPVASGFAVSSAFSDTSGDRIIFYVTETPDGYQIEDDGSYLSELIARDIPIDQGQRGQLLDAILAGSGAYWDRETFEIRTPAFAEKEISRHAIDFLSSLIRVRDLELLTREVVRSTFREDATAAINASYGKAARFDEDAAVSRDFSEFPADLIIRPNSDLKEARTGAIYFVNTDAKLNEALLLKMEAEQFAAKHQKPVGFNVIALLEDPNLKTISRRKFQRAQNRSLSMPIFRGDEDGAMSMIGRELGLQAAA